MEVEKPKKKRGRKPKKPVQKTKNTNSLSTSKINFNLLSETTRLRNKT